MRALWLSSVKMRGLERMRRRPLASAADNRTARFTVLSTEPSERPIAPPEPVPTAAGRLTAKFGLATVLANGLKPAVGVFASLAPPTTPTEFGNASPVGLPVAAENVPSPPH